MSKDRIIATLGDSELLLPGLISDALSANERVKYLLTLLQSARSAADGEADVSDLHEERLASGVSDARLDRVVHASARLEDGAYAVPGAGELVGQAFEEVQTMLAPLQIAGMEAYGELEERLRGLARAVRPEGEKISAREISRLTSARQGHEDSLHLVVMDAHRELNQLAGRLARESIAGALAYGLQAADRPLVGAFARGVERTQHLRFDHPGLGTVATRAGDALLIQNDIGETEAHVVVVKVVERAVTVTYTDVHLPRLLFLQRMLADTNMHWEDTRSRGGSAGEDLYHLAVGRFTADSQQSLEAFLELLGSRLVFLIDWNRARKRLRNLVGNRAAIELLDWAAQREYGHMAFLLAGGEGLIYDALNFATRRGARAGQSLLDVLGEAAAISYLRAVLHICSDGLLAGRSLSLVGDEVFAELIGYVRTARQELLELVGAHAELVVAIGEAARDGLEQAALAHPSRDRSAVAGLAREWEQRADELVNEVRAACASTEDSAPFLELIREADDVADALEEAAYGWSLLPQGRVGGKVLRESRRMMALPLEAARSYLRAVNLARAVQRGSPSEDMDSFLEATDRIVASERDADESLRDLQGALVNEVEAAGELFVIAQATQAGEDASDALMRAAHLLHRQVLGSVVRSEPPPARPEPTSGRVASVREESGSIEEDLYVLGEGDSEIPDVARIGAKGYGLARMARAGLPVPEAAILGTGVYRSTAAGSDGARLRTLVSAAVGALQTRSGLRLGSARRPLILSVRSGAPASMPGMLETVLDVGLCDESVEGLITMTGNPRLAWDSYRRLVESFAHVVAHCPLEPFEQATNARMEAATVQYPHDLDARTLAELTGEHLERFRALTGKPFPQNPIDQVEAAARGVLESWDAPKAREYRQLHALSEALGTAVILQRMVFGNAGGVSGSGVGFTRDPATGEHHPYVEFMLDAQGEDVVSGRRATGGAGELALLAPEVQHELDHVCQVLEAEFRDAQEFEFTVQDGELFLLQTRTAKRTPWAALHIAVDQVGEGLLSTSEARKRLAGLDLQHIRRTRVREDGARVICRAEPVSMGVASGPIALDVEAAERIAHEGHAPVLVRRDSSTEDIAGMIVAAGLLTSSGGRTSHAAVVARELSKPCVVGASDIDIDMKRRRISIGDRELAEGDEISIDGESGCVFAGRVQVEEERPTAELAAVAGW